MRYWSPFPFSNNSLSFSRKLVSNGVVNGNHSNPFADLDVSGLAAESQSSSSQETKVTAGLPVDLPVEVLEAVEKLKIVSYLGDFFRRLT